VTLAHQLPRAIPVVLIADFLVMNGYSRLETAQSSLLTAGLIDYIVQLQGIFGANYNYSIFHSITEFPVAAFNWSA